MTDFPEILPDRDPTPPEPFDVDEELHRLAAEVRRLALVNAELTGCLQGMERWLRDGISIGPRGETWKAVRDLLARHARA